MNTVHTLCWLMTVIPVLQSSGQQQDNFCVSPQYLELGRTGTISCTFQDDLFSVLWYNTTDYSHNEPMLQYQNSIKTGVGFESGEYDIHLNGSLSINKVSLQHNRTFTVAYIPTEEDVPTFIKIRIIVTHETLARCPSPQFGHVGDLAIIRCHIVVNFEGISWFKDGIDNAIVTYTRTSNGDTSGAPEYYNGDYGLFIDGSLLIYEVGSEKANVKYTVELIDSGTVGKLSQTVDFIATNATAAETSTAATEVYTSTGKSGKSKPLPQIITTKGPLDVPILLTDLLILLLIVSMVIWFCVLRKRKYERKQKVSA